jgi:hypothetical protein
MQTYDVTSLPKGIESLEIVIHVDYVTTNFSCTINGIDIEGKMFVKDYGTGFEPLRNEHQPSWAVMKGVYLVNNSIYANRNDCKCDVSEVAKRKLLDIIPPIVTKWAQDNKREFIVAELEHNKTTLIVLEREIEGFLSKLDSLVKERDVVISLVSFTEKKLESFDKGKQDG